MQIKCYKSDKNIVYKLKNIYAKIKSCKNLISILFLKKLLVNI